MSNKNYTRYSKMSCEEPMLVNEVETEVLPEVAVEENESAVIEQPIVHEPEAPVESEPAFEPEIRKFGKVHGCKKLNVRKMPNPAAEVLIEMPESSKLMIDEKDSTAVFYKVCTEFGVEGYCMKQYVKVLP